MSFSPAIFEDPVNLDLLCLEVQLKIEQAYFIISAANGYIQIYSLKDSTFLTSPLYPNLASAIQSKRLTLDLLRRLLIIESKLKELKNMQPQPLDLTKK